MSNTDEWVSFNLMRQRKILEDKQRARRLQSSGPINSTYSTINTGGGGGGVVGRPTTAAAPSGPATRLIRSSSSTITSNNSQSTAATSYDLGSSGRFTAGLTIVSRPESEKQHQPVAAGPRPSSSLYSFGGSQQQQQQREDQRAKSAAVSIGGSNEPKIITIKGLTPPQGRKIYSSGNDSLVSGGVDEELIPIAPPLLPLSSSSPPPPHSHGVIDSNRGGSNGGKIHAPTVNVDYRLGDVRSHDSATTTPLVPNNHHRSSQAHPSQKHPHQQRRPSCMGIDYTDEEAIPTEVLNEDSNTTPLDVVDIINNLDAFVMEPTRKNTTLRCKITRDKKGMDKLYPIYYCHLEKGDGRKVFLLAARRRKKSATANYLISTDPTDLSRCGKSFTAKVRSNAMGTMFTLYDNGDNPKKAAVIGEGIRRELAAVIYETNVLGLKGPRKMTIIIPGIYCDEKTRACRPMSVRPISEKDCILERYKNHRLDEMVILNNKQPVWNEDTQSYVLNFHGRVTQASVKNFQIVHCINGDYVKPGPYGSRQSTRAASTAASEYSNEYIVMQFGRIDNESFTMDIRYPLSPVQAFGIAMTSFHGKLGCE